MIETVLVSTDGSEASRHAERLGVTLCARLKARLLGLTVVEDRLFRGWSNDGLGVAPPALDGLQGYLKERADAVCRRLSETARAQGLEANCETLSGVACDRIVERTQGSDLVVLGRDGVHAAFRTGLIGSTADGVIRKLAKPAIVVPGDAELSGPLLLAFDGSPGSRLAANLAVQIATRLAESVHVFVDSKDKGRAASRFEEVRHIVGRLPVPVRETSSTLGRPDMKIVDTAREVRAGLIVMGAYGRNRISEFFLGSNSAAVVRTSPVAVLLAR